MLARVKRAYVYFVKRRYKSPCTHTLAHLYIYEEQRRERERENEQRAEMVIV